MYVCVEVLFHFISFLFYLLILYFFFHTSLFHFVFSFAFLPLFSPFFPKPEFVDISLFFPTNFLGKRGVPLALETSSKGDYCGTSTNFQNVRVNATLVLRSSRDRKLCQVRDVPRRSGKMASNRARKGRQMACPYACWDCLSFKRGWSLVSFTLHWPDGPDGRSSGRSSRVVRFQTSAMLPGSWKVTWRIPLPPVYDVIAPLTCDWGFPCVVSCLINNKITN